MRRKLVSLAVAFGAVASVLTTSGTGASSTPNQLAGVGSITWGPCDNPTLVRFGAECGMLSVPLDWSRPNGQKIQLAVSRVVHTVPDDQYQGVMLVNPGGPGGSGLVYSVLGAFVPGGVGASYDWIGFDPRGVGSSVPALSCDPDYFAGPRPPYEPTTPKIEAAWLARSITYAVKCRVNGGRLLDHVKTTDSVEDMNAIRQALDAEQINYYGFSYGTYLGQVFATLHPELVRRMVLDSNVDPRRVWYPANIDQDYAFQTVIEIFFDWVARHDDVFGLGATAAEVEAHYNAALASLTASPQGQLGASEWVDAFLVAGYVQFLWPDVASAFAAFVNDGDPGPATDLYLAQDGPGDDNGFAMYLGTECSDASWPRSWSFWHRDNARVAADAPFFTWGNAWFNAPVRVLARSVRAAGRRQREHGGTHPPARRDARRRHAVPGQPRGAPTVPAGVAHRHRRRDEPREQPVRRCVVRRRRGRRLPRRRHAAGAPGRRRRRPRVPAGPGAGAGDRRVVPQARAAAPSLSELGHQLQAAIAR